MPLSIHSKHDGYRRCGVVHTTQPVTYADDRFSAEELDRLRRDPHLVVVEHATAELVTTVPPADDAGEQTPAEPAQIDGIADAAPDVGAATADQPAAAPASAKKKARKVVMYLTPAQLIDGPDSAKEYAQLFGVDALLLAAVIGGGDTSAWPPGDVARAESARDSIERFIVQATGEVDTRLAQRGYPLPQDAVRFPVLLVWTRSIARYHLHRERDRTTEDSGRIERDYRDALRALDLVAQGKLSLGAGDPLAPEPTDPADPATGAVRMKSNPRMFSRDSLGDL